jgi:hypothetical protein
VEQERPHRQDVTPASDALERAMLIAQGPGRRLRQATVSMRAGHDTERAIPRPAVIEVRAHGNERIQHGHRRLDVENSFLLGPTGARMVCDTFLDRNAQVLVQRNEPVLVRRFVEERALNRHGASGKEGPDLTMRFERRRKPLAGGNIE